MAGLIDGVVIAIFLFLFSKFGGIVRVGGSGLNGCICVDVRMEDGGGVCGGFGGLNGGV